MHGCTNLLIGLRTLFEDIEKIIVVLLYIRLCLCSIHQNVSIFEHLATRS